jgi:glycine cleavage system H protein
MSSGLKYTKEHEWVRVEGDVATVGISDFAQSQLGDVVFVELPEVGSQVKRDGNAAVVESVKAASDVYAPVSGEVVEVNGALEDAPQLVNESPVGDGWFIKIRLSDPSELDALMDEAAYADYSASQA